MAENLLTQSATPATLSASVSLATEELADGSHAGVVVLVDPADRSKAAKPNASGSLNVEGPVTDAQLRATAVPVSLASFPATVDTNDGNSGASTLRTVLATDQPILSTAFPSTARGTQGATGLATQDLKDAGRQAVNLVVDAYQVAATAETLINTMQSSADNAANTTGLSEYEVPAGKRFRIEGILIILGTVTGNTTAAGISVRIRTTTGASVATTSPLQFSVQIAGVAAANASSVSPVPLSLPDGWELPPGHKIGSTVACPGYVVTTAAPTVRINIIGYLY